MNASRSTVTIVAFARRSERTVTRGSRPPSAPGAARRGARAGRSGPCHGAAGEPAGVDGNPRLRLGTFMRVTPSAAARCAGWRVTEPATAGAQARTAAREYAAATGTLHPAHRAAGPGARARPAASWVAASAGASGMRRAAVAGAAGRVAARVVGAPGGPQRVEASPWRAPRRAGTGDCRPARSPGEQLRRDLPASFAAAAVTVWPPGPSRRRGCRGR